MSLALARTLLLSDAISRVDLARALRAHARGESLVRALVHAGVDARRIEAAVGTWDGPVVSRVEPAEELVRGLPAEMMERLLAVPIRRDPRTGTVDVAVVDPHDPHAAAEIGHALDAPVRVVRAPLASIVGALKPKQGSPEPEALAAPIWLEKPVPKPGRTMPWDDDAVPESQSYEPIPLTVRRGDDPSNGARRRHSSVAPIPLVSSRPPGSAPPRPPFPEPGVALEALRLAKGRDEVMRALLDGVRVVARRVGLLAIKRDVFVGKMCTPELCSESAWQAVQVSTSYPSALATAAAEGTYLGAILPSEAHDPLLGAVKSTTRDVAVTPVRVGGRPALLVFADELGDAALSTKRMEDLARVGGLALARVLREARKGSDEP